MKGALIIRLTEPPRNTKNHPRLRFLLEITLEHSPMYQGTKIKSVLRTLILASLPLSILLFLFHYLI